MSGTGAGWRVGIDVGGTFTDVLAWQPGGGELRQAKVPSRPGEPLAALGAALGAVGLGWEEVAELVHGTTMVTNAIVEGRLARVALVATEGFADTLAIGRQNRRHLYRLDLPPKLEPQVPEALRFELAERVAADGSVLQAPGEEALGELVEQLVAARPEAVAVALLHAYANPEHERLLGERLRRRVPWVALSHRISPEAREYERTATTALAAGVMPLAAGYLAELERVCPRRTRLRLFHSAGGMAAPGPLREQPLGLALSGPAAGVAAAGRVARELGIEHALSFDMGGTTTDVCLISGGEAEVRSDRRLAGRPLRMPMVAVESIGAGGGSIARLADGVLQVGPESAGADPGPACYRRGGERPTVSDANLVLGYLDGERALGGGIVLDRAAAEAALAPLAAAAGAGLAETALGVVRVANAAMARALRRVTVERGIDGRACTLIAFGGAGPMHAVELARSFGIERVVVPACSSVFSALGCLSAELRYTRQHTVRMASGAWEAERLAGLRAALAEELLEALGEERSGARLREIAALRYSGQSYAVEIEAPALAEPERLAAQFRERHRALYGFATEEPWELVALRLSAAAPRPSVPLRASAAPGAAAPPREARCWFAPGAPLATPRLARDTLAPGTRIEGPAIVEDPWSTVVVPPGALLEADRHGHLHITTGSAR